MGIKNIWELGIEDFVKAGLNLEDALKFNTVLQNAVSMAKRSDPREVWRDLMGWKVLKPTHPYGLHHLIYYSVYANWDFSSNGPPLHWFPSL